jgi:hypothetical protein
MASSAADGAVEWWNTGGKDKAEAIAKEAAQKAAEGALKAGQEYADKKLAENDAKLKAVDVKVDNLGTLTGVNQEWIDYKKRQESQGKPIDYTVMAELVVAYLAAKAGIYGTKKGIGVLTAAKPNDTPEPPEPRPGA